MEKHNFKFTVINPQSDVAGRYLKAHTDPKKDECWIDYGSSCDGKDDICKIDFT